MKTLGNVNVNMTEIQFSENKTESEKTDPLGGELKLQVSYVNSKKNVRCSKSICCVNFRESILILFGLIFMGMTIWALILWTDSLAVVNKNNNQRNYTQGLITLSPQDNFKLTSRTQWLAQPPTEALSDMKTPISLIILHHTATAPCSTPSACIYQTRLIQAFHVESNGWADIGYNFLVGGDGRAYEGRGWTKVGAHTLNRNNVSLGVAFIGTFSREVPPDGQIRALQELLGKGVQSGYLDGGYKIATARQFSNTESPGKAFYDVIKTWDNWEMDVSNS